MEREVHAVLGPVGVSEQTSRSLATELRQVEVDVSASSTATPNGNGNGTVTKRQSWMSLGTWGRKTAMPAQVVEEESQPLRWQEDVGLTAFLLKFGEGMGA
jgi:hypothetical protein